MPAPSLPSLAPSVITTLNPASAATRGVYAGRKRPLVAGYDLRAEGTDILLVGVNHPGSMVGGFPVGSLVQNTGGQQTSYTSPRDKVFGAVGKGATTAAQLANGFENYTIGANGDFVVVPGASATLPQDTDVSAAATYANAIAIAWPVANKDSNRAVLLTRIARTGSFTNNGQWRVNNATSIDVCWDYNATPANSRGLPAEWRITLILPAAADIVTLVDSGDATASISNIKSCDFMFAGSTTRTGIVTLSRSFQ